MRTIEAVRQEYFDACARLGEHQFNLAVDLPRKIADLEARIAQLRAEAEEIAKTPAAPVEAPAS